MEKFNFKGIEIKATDKPKVVPYTTPDGQQRERYHRNICVIVRFWEYVIKDDLYELAFIKSVLNFFMQAYWKRSTKDGSRIVLEETLEPGDDSVNRNLSLHFNARQLHKIVSLHVCLKNDEGVIEELYLSAREVNMLDIAINKAITMLQAAVAVD